MLFLLKTRKLDLEQYMDVADIFIGHFGGKHDPLAKLARNEGLYKSLKMNTLPEIGLHGLKDGEDLEIALSGPNAVDTALGINGLGAIVKAKLKVWDGEIARVHAKVSMTGLSIKGDAHIDHIGPLTLTANGKIDAQAGLKKSPHFFLNTSAKLLGAEADQKIEFSSAGIRLEEKLDIAGLGEAAVTASTVGKKLSKMKAFEIKGEIEQHASDKVAGFIGDGIKAAFPHVGDHTVKAITDRVKSEAEFFSLQKVALDGEITTTGKDTLTLTLVAKIAGHREKVSATVQGVDKGQVADAVSEAFKEFGSQLFAIRLPSFDKDLVRKRSDELYFYEGKDCTQQIAGTAPYHYPKAGKTKVIHPKDVDWFQNDEARSLLLRKLKKGAIIALYDRADGKLTDDVTVIEVLKNTDHGLCIGDLEQSHKDKNGRYRVFAFHKNGLNGKVSRVKVSTAGHSTLPPDIVFFEGKHCEQGVKGVFNSDKSHKNTDCTHSKACDNDEIKSVRLMAWGDDPYSINVYDNHDADHDDDWARIKVNPAKMTTGSVCIGTLEKDHTTKDGSVSIDYHKHNGLDGKVSHIRIYK